MNFLEWNDAIAGHYFHEGMAHRRVFLAVTEDVIAEIGRRDGVGIEDFLLAVRAGPPWTSSEPDVCRKAQMTVTGWRERGLSYPPYVGFLAAFVLAASGLEGFASQAYYSPLSKLLDQDVRLKHFEPMHSLWFDLRNWSRDDKQNGLGIFRPGIRPGSAYTNVGLPRSQTLLLSAERAALPRFFADNRLDPTSLPSEATMLRALSSASFLRPSTRHLLQKDDPAGRELQAALAGFVLDELQAWDGSIWGGSVEECPSDSQAGVRSTWTTAVLRLCLKINTLGGRANFTARFKANRPFPDGELNLQASASAPVWVGRESQDGWSWPLSRSDDAQKLAQKVTLDASMLDWTCGQTFEDAELGWRVALPPGAVRLFLPGRREGLHEDWVESSHLVPGCPFCIACRSGDSAAIEEWGRTYSEALQAMDLTGLPRDWTLFRAQNARPSRSEFALLNLSSRRRLRLIGGVRAEGRHAYFHFDRPAITLDGGEGTEKLSCPESPLTRDGDGLWRFPDDAPMHKPLRVTCGEETLTLTLLPTELRLNYDAPALDPWGALAETGGRARGVEAPEDGLLPQPTDIPTHFGGHIVFLGRRAGEVADWPSDPLPHDWRPLWAVVKVRRDEWRAHFVGASADLAAVRLVRRGNWKRWREVYGRRRTEPVGVKRVRDFWAQCAKEALRV